MSTMPPLTPRTPLEIGGEMFQRAKTASLLETRSSTVRPVSQVTDTDFETDSDFEEYSPKRSFESVSNQIRSSNT